MTENTDNAWIGKAGGSRSKNIPESAWRKGYQDAMNGWNRSCNHTLPAVAAVAAGSCTRSNPSRRSFEYHKRPINTICKQAPGELEHGERVDRGEICRANTTQTEPVEQERNENGQRKRHDKGHFSVNRDVLCLRLLMRLLWLFEAIGDRDRAVRNDEVAGQR